MSGLVKGVKKVFKAVGSAVKKIVKSPIFKAVAIAAAVYFTGGLAMGAMGSTFAASLPGISGAAEALGITAGAFGEAATVGATALGGAVAEGAATLADGAAPELLGFAGEQVASGGAAAVNALDVAAPSTSLASSGGGGGAGAFGVSGADAGNAGAFAASKGGALNAASGAWNGMSQGAQKMVLEGLKEGGMTIAKGLFQKQALDQQEKEYQQGRDDAIRRGGVPDISSIYAGSYKTPGVVNSFLNKPTGA